MEEQKKKIYSDNDTTQIKPNIIIFIILINMLPVIVANFGRKESMAVPDIIVIIIYIIQMFVMLLYLCKRKVKINKITRKYIIVWSAITLILLMVQLYYYMFDQINIQDIMNVLSKYATVFIFIIIMFSVTMPKEDINKIFKFLLCIGLIACIYNFIFYFNEITNFLKIQTSYSVNIKSFFANRNQFAQFLVISTIANTFLIKENKQLKYKISISILLLNILFTMSRTAILVTFVFFAITYLYNKNIRDKLIIIISTLAIFILIIVFLYQFRPEILQDINTLFIRAENLENASGRADIWKAGLEVGSTNVLLGVGRFRGIDILNSKGLDFTQFHNIFIESYVSGGLLELLVLIYLTIIILSNLNKNRYMDKNRKAIYISSFISFLVMGMFESCNRFSIGYVDTIFTIFFISIPILELNLANKSKLKNEEINIK